MNDNNQTSETYFIGGAIQSPFDERDYIAETIYPAKEKLNLPLTLDLRPKLQPVQDQGKQGTCVAESTVCMKEYQEKLDVDLKKKLSPQFIYNIRSNYPNDGMHCRNAMDIITKYGCCIEELYPYGKIETKDKIPKKAFDNALNYKIQSYAQVNTIDGVKTALYKNGVCIIAFPCYNYSKTFWKQKKDQKLLGGHCVSIVGYTKTGFIIRNSWGKSWGDKGYTNYPYDQFGSHWEIWTSIDENSEKIDLGEDKKKCCNII
jgi:C1A family cysteine protease